MAPASFELAWLLDSYPEDFSSSSPSGRESRCLSLTMEVPEEHEKVLAEVTRTGAWKENHSLAHLSFPRVWKPNMG